MSLTLGGKEPADVRKVWDTVMPGLLKIKEKSFADWRPEDIYALCLYGKATLFVDGKSFVVIQLATKEFTGETILFILASYSELNDGMVIYQPEIDSLARRLGASRIEMVSSRKGYEKVSGWEVQSIRYSRRISP